MRIAYVCADPGVPVFGRKGCSVHVQEVIRALLREGHEVTLLARRWGGDPPADLDGIACQPLPQVPGTDQQAREAALAAADRETARLLSAREPFDMVYERYSLWSGSAMDWARDRAVPGVLEVNAPLVEEQARHRTLHDRTLAEAMSARAFAAAHCLVAVSSGVAAWLESAGADPEKIEIIPNGVDLARFAPADSTERTVPVIGFVGTLKPWHGTDILVEAAERLRGQGVPFHLLLVGDGPERASLESLVATDDLSGLVEFTGAVDPDAIPALLDRIDIAVAPYPALADFYFSPLKVMEYMAAGKAIAASCIGDIDGLVTDGETGLLCPPGDAGALAAALALLCTDRDLRLRLGAAARDRARADLGWDRAVRRILRSASARVPC